MADFDDERPDFDAVFRDPPADDPPVARRRAARRRRMEPEDSESTGEVPRPRLGEEGSPPPPDPSGPTDSEDEPDPEPRPGRGGRSPRATRSRSSARPRSGGSGARSPRSGRSRGGGSGGAAVLQGPRRRLLLGVAFAAVLVVVALFVVKDCQRSQLEDSYTQYINGAAQLVSKSSAQGAELRKVMANPRGDKPPQLKTKIAAIAKQAQGVVGQAEDLDPPGSLSAPQRALVTVFEYRVTGLKTLAENLPTLLQGTDQQSKALGIAGSMARFLASDVFYQDSFAGPAAIALKQDDITGIKVPPLQRFLPNAALASADGAKGLIPALENTATSGTGTAAGAGNLLGTSLEKTVASPSDTRLTQGETASIPAASDLAWQVTVKNGGDFDVKNVIVKASFSYPAKPNEIDSREVEIPAIALGESVTVPIPGPSADKVDYGEQATLKIEVVAVAGEKRIDNNSAEYPVTISL